MFFSCRNNIRGDINSANILTSGYVLIQAIDMNPFSDPDPALHKPVGRGTLLKLIELFTYPVSFRSLPIPCRIIEVYQTLCVKPSTSEKNKEEILTVRR